MSDANPTGEIRKLLEIMAHLRDPKGGCPWDLEQDFASIAPFTVEEAYEVADAIDRKDFSALRGELGDLLFQVVFHARMAEERGAFDFADVVAGLNEKMVRRHPHVFDEAEVASAEAQTHAWEAHKRAEREARGEGLLADIPLALPALARAVKLTRRAATVGFDWPDAAAVRPKVDEELDELDRELRERAVDRARVGEELGDLLFALANYARHLEVDPESALRAAGARFERRFAAMEAQADAEGGSLDAMTLGELDALWEEAKTRERAGPEKD